MKDYKIQAIIDDTIKSYKHRKVVVWGKCKSGEMVSEALLKQHDIQTEFIIDSNTNLVNGTTVRNIEEVRGLRDEYFIIIPLRYHKVIIDALAEFGYMDTDFTYSSHKPISTTKDQMDHHRYSDIYGNRILGDIGNCRIIFMGYNSTVQFGESTKVKGTVDIIIEDDVHVEIGNHISILGTAKWHFRPEAVVTIGDHCDFQQDGMLTCGRRSTIVIGSNTSLGKRYWVVANTRTRIEIGNDCMISGDVMIRTSDRHSIFDIRTGKNINSGLDEQHLKNIHLHDHIWVGAKSTLLYKTEIQSGSIVGAHSLVKQKFPNNCIIVGNPARVVRRDIAWSKENNQDNMDIIPDEYVNYTLDIE